MNKRKKGLNTLKKKISTTLKYLEKSDVPENKSLIKLLKEITELQIDPSIQKETFFRTTLYSIGDAVITTDVKGRVQQINPIAEKLCGWKEADAKNKPLDSVFKIINGITKKKVENSAKKILKSGHTMGLANNTLLISKTGKQIPIADSSAPIKDENRNIIGVVIIFRDQTEDRAKQNTLEERERKFSTLVSNLPGFIYQCAHDKNWTMEFISDGCKKITGYSANEFIKNNKLAFKDVIHPDYQKQIWKKWQKVLKDKTYFEFEYPIITKSGKINWVWERGRGVYSDKGKLLLLEGFITDISELKEAEDALRMFQFATDQSPDAVYWMKSDASFYYVNDQACKSLGYKREELMKLTVFDIDPVYPKDKWKEAWQKFHNKEISAEKIETYHKRKDCTIFPIEVTAMHCWFDQTDLHIAFVRNISERKQSEEFIKEIEISYRRLFDSVSEAIYILDENSVFLDVNEGAVLMHGYDKETLVGKTSDFISAPGKNDLESVSLMVQKAFLGEKQQFEFWGKRKNGEEFLKDVRLYPASYFTKNVIIEIANDITEKQKAEQRLRESEERYRAISNLTSDYLFSTKADKNGVHNIVWIAGSFEKITGYTVEEYQSIGGWRATLHPEELELDVLDLEKLKRNEKVNRQIRVYHKNGSLIWVRSSAQPVWDKTTNKLIGIYGAVEDITEQKQTEIIQKIQYNIADAAVTYKTLTDLIENIRLELSAIINVNNFFIALYDENTGMLRSDVDKDEVDEISEWPAKDSMTGYVIEQEKSVLLNRSEINNLIRSGKAGMVGTIPEMWLGVPFKIGGKVFGVLVVQSYDNPNAYNLKSIEVLEIVAHELSIFIKHKNAEDEALKLSTAIVQSPTIVIISDPEGNIEFTNPKFTEVTGYPFEEVKWKNPRILNSGFHDRKFYSNLWKTILSGNIWQGEFKNKKKNGELYWENAIISPLIDLNGKITHFVAVKEDVTAKKKMIQELIEAKEKAEEMHRIKSSFFANMSHELRTPMVGILGFSEVLMNELKDNPEYFQMINSINRSGNRLLETLNQILNLSKIDSGKVEAKLKTVNIIPFVEEGFYSFSSVAAKKQLIYKLNCNYDEVLCKIDTFLFQSIINNLLNNAIKFTEQGSITFTVNTSKDFVVIQISDTGVGISEEKQKIIWEEFRQASEGYNRSFEGTGLGLTIAKNYANLMNGTIFVESKVGAGTIFIFSLPLAINESEEKGTIQQKSDETLLNEIQLIDLPKILYIEDDEIAFKLVSTITKGFYIIDFAKDSDEALQKVNNTVYDAILMDINLHKGVDGLELTGLIRKIINYKTTPIIALTAFAMGGEKEEFLSKGMTHYLSKPFVKQQLFDILKLAITGK